jgi:hypothetical protein
LEEEEEEVPVIPAGCGPVVDRGQWSAPSWLEVMTDFDSAPRYRKFVDHFLVFEESSEDTSEGGMCANVAKYFRRERSLGRKTSTLRSRYSALKMFWTHTSRGDLAVLMPGIDEMFCKWQKKDVTVQARTFTREDYGKLYGI